MPDSTSPAAPKDNPLANILINVIIPVLALSYLSKDPALQAKLGKEIQPWHIGPAYAMVVALAFPIVFGIRHFLRTRKANFISLVGLVSVLLTGGLTLYLWNADGTVKPYAAPLFGIKEAMVPLILGILALTSHKGKSPLVRTMLYSPNLFDIDRIERHIAANGQQDGYRRLLWQSTLMFAGSFLLSTVMNFFLALYFLGGLDRAAPDALELYNSQIARLTGWSFAVIGAPILLFLFLTLMRLLAGLRKLTGLTNDDILLAK
jgi:hypothetical protein